MPAFLLACAGESTKQGVTPPAVRDSTAPVVTATRPTDGTTDAALNSTFSVTFSEPVNAATLTATSMTIVSMAGGAVATIAGTITFNGTAATFAPSTPLTGSTRYTATITTAVKDLAGNALASDYVWSFTTIPPPDVTPPTVLGTTPLNDAVNVAVSAVPTVTLSEPMNIATLNTSTIVLMKAGDTTRVAGTVTLSGNTATLQPTSALAAGTRYTMTITTGAKDVSGNALAAAVSWSFTTLSPVVTASLMWRVDVPGVVTMVDAARNLAIEASGHLLLRAGSSYTYSGIDIATGAVSWTTTMPASVYGSWIMAPLFVVSGSYVNPATGAVQWTPDGRTDFESHIDLLVIGETIVVKIRGDTLGGFDRRTGREKWRARMGPLDCQNATSCGLLKTIGAEGTNGYLLRTSSNEAQIITITETGISREIVVQSDVARTIWTPPYLGVVKGSSLVVVVGRNATAAGIDPVTGAERWRTGFATIGGLFSPLPTTRSFLTPDGSLLFLEFTGPLAAEAVLLAVVDTRAGTLSRLRTLSRTENATSIFERCGDEGLAQLTPSGLEYTNLRTGVRTAVPRPGLYDAVQDEYLTGMHAIGSDRVLFSGQSGSTPAIGVMCRP